MAAFFRKNNKTTIAELEEYYAGQNRAKNSSRAWFMALASLLITVLVLMALFFGARWVYRALTNNDNSTTTVISGEDEVTLPSYDGDIAGSVNTNTGSIDDLGNNNDGSTTAGVVDDQAVSTDTSNSGVTGSGTEDESTETTTVNGSNTLPDTGAGSNILAVLLGTSILGYLVSRRRQLQ